MKPWKIGLAAAGGMGVALAAYATLVERYWLETTRPRIHIRDLPPALEGLRVALLTDLHAGGATPLSLVRRAVRLSMRERPHMVALAGDFAADDAKDFGPVLDALAELDAPLGVYAVPGNHDYIVGIDHWRAQVAAHPRIIELTNAAVVQEFRGARVCIAGVDDFYRGAPRLSLPDPAARDLTILLSHGPDQAEQLRRLGDAVDLVLSGHTHGGQVKVPGLGAPVNPAEHDDLYVEGLRRRPWTQVYTSRGIGTVRLPVRFGSRPEVAVLTLTASRRESAPHRRRSGTRRSP